MGITVEPVQVPDGHNAPTADQLHAAAEDPANHGKRPTDSGYRHAHGSARTVTRYRWVSSATGKTSGRCTYPTEQAAKEEGQRHERSSRQWK